MSVKYLYYTEDSDFGGNLSTANLVPLLDQLLNMYGGERMCIHPAWADYSPSANEAYATLADAQLAYPSHAWIYLDSSATIYLDELEHPIDDVVYAVGHDATGYGKEFLNAEKYKLRVKPENFEGFAIISLSIAIIDRWNHIKSWL